MKLRQAVLIACGLALSARWLPAADWTEGKGFRAAALEVPTGGKAGFTLLDPSVTGITFTNFLPEARYRTNSMLLNGSGVACGDVDGDGWCDIYFCRLEGPNVLYKNLGNWKFQDITDSAGVACSNLDCSGAALADLDGDGDLDLIVNSVGGGTHIFLNDGKGHFTELTKSAPLNPSKGGMSLALGDLDGDGYLDLYVANYRVSALPDMPQTKFWLKKINGRQVISTVNGRPVTEPDLANRYVVTERGGIEELGEVDALYRNQGGTNFVPISFTDGTFLDEAGKPLAQPPFDWGLSVMIRDINQDGLPDIYVCNDFDSPERLWINQGRGTFRAVPRLALRKTSLFSMGVDVADINRDGFDDIFVLDMLSRDHQRRMNFAPDRNAPIPKVGEIDNRPQYPRNMLFLNRGDGTYAEMAPASGLDASEWSWCAIFIDVDLDGWEDVLITNGLERDGRNLDVAERLKAMRAARPMSNAEILEARKLFPRLATANVAFRNRKDLTFEDKSQEWGFNFVAASHGMALADLDNDGDLDVVVNNMNEPANIYRNNSSAPRLAVKLKGAAPNTAGVGARINVLGGPVAQSQEMISGGRYLSSDAPMRTFAAGAPTNELTIEVAWRSGRHSSVTGAKPNHIYEIDEPNLPIPNANPPSSNTNPHFQDVSALIAHQHQDEPFDDYARQPLLPKKLSQLGPGASWFDLDRDGWDDLIIASGKGGQLAVFRNDGGRRFIPWEGPPLNQPVTRDQTAVLGLHQGATKTLLLAGSANYEDGLAVGSCVRQYDFSAKAVLDTLPGQESSTGPLALADLDGDGNLDLFVGGRCLPGKYPAAASSMIFRNVGGRFELDTANTKRLAGVGLVSGAVFSDLDGDGLPELILACEWGPLKLFRNDHGQLAPWDPTLTLVADTRTELQLITRNTQLGTLGQLTGWWNGVTTGDFDGDGRPDIVASNWGRNSRYESHRREPLQVFYGDLNGDGAGHLIETYYDVAMQKWVPERGLDVVAKALPFLREKFASHEAYGQASLEEILGDHLKAAHKASAVWLESTVFLNRGGHFEARPLPVEAQLAPAFGICVGDLDGNGTEDIFLSQNFFVAPPETPRYDAGRGLWLKGNGHGEFSAVPGQESGIKVYGEQRGCALADFDGDGRADLVVTQNGAETRLYKNAGAKPGLRVRLLGPPGNPYGVGASLRLGDGTNYGAAREIHAGSGYWSQDSAVQVLSALGSPAQLWVRWPGGATNQVALKTTSREITLDAAGVLHEQ